MAWKANLCRERQVRAIEGEVGAVIDELGVVGGFVPSEENLVS